MKQWISANGGILAVLAVVALILGAYNEWRIAVAVQAKFDEAGLISEDRVKGIEGDVVDLKRADDKFDDKLTRIIDILLEE